MPSQAPGKVTPRTNSINNMTKGKVAVKYTTFPTDLTPFIMHRYTIIQEVTSQRSNSQTMEPGLSILSEICNIFWLQHSSKAFRSKEEVPSTLIFARNNFKYSQRRHVCKPRKYKSHGWWVWIQKKDWAYLPASHLAALNRPMTCTSGCYYSF